MVKITPCPYYKTLVNNNNTIRKRLLDNPMKMKALQQHIETLQQKKKEMKKKKKKKKKKKHRGK